MHRIYFFIQVLALSFLLSLVHGSTNAAIAPSTAECGAIAVDTTWTAAASPYDVCASGVVVNAGVTLTVEPGATVQFTAASGNKLYVIGTLKAKGTAALPITFTGNTASTGSWGGISISGSMAAPAVASLDNVVLDFGGTAGTYGAAIYVDQASITIDHSVIENSAGNGIYTTQNTNLSINNTSFTGNGQNALQLNSYSGDLLMTGLSASGNGTNAVRLAGTTIMPGQRRWMYPGIPYVVDSPVSNVAGDVLTIDPGNTLQFTTNGLLGIGGHLIALGTATEPIVMTGLPQTIGIWRGIVVNGGTFQAGAQLDYVTLEYGGNDIHGANIEVADGTFSIRNSIIRYSLNDGVKVDPKAGGSIMESQIYGNTLQGVNNTVPTRAVLATNDWWGDASGPQSAVAGCSTGKGQAVSAGVLFTPFLTSAGGAGTLALSSAPSITLTPQRWFAPADGITRIFFDIYLKDGNGTPMPGRTVRLYSPVGTVVDGGITDANGHTLAYITSNTTGDADVFATLDALTSCEYALSPDSKVTFTTPINVTDLLPNAPASYLDGDIQVTPLPVVVGVNTTVSARFTNPLSTPVTMNVEFGFAQAGIGLVFGPIKDFVGQVLPGNSSIILTAAFVPSVPGHYCVQVTYNITAVGIAKGIQPLSGGSGSKQRNLNVYHPPTSSPQQSHDLDKTRNSLKAVNQWVQITYKPNPFAVPLFVANQGINWDLKTAEKISGALNGDPPRQDYKIIDVPKVLTTSHVQPGSGVTVAHANALNDLIDALDQANAYGTAAATAFDRSSGATEAQDLQWESTQTGVMLQYEVDFGTWLITSAQKIDALIAEAGSEGVTTVPVSISDVTTMQQALSINGWSAQEIADAHAAGLTDADLSTFLTQIVAANPQDMAGDVITNMQQVSAAFYLLGGDLTHPTFFDPPLVVAGGIARPFMPKATGNTMAQPYDLTTTIQLANPLATTELINISVRRISLPADWNVVISPAQVSLGPGAQTTVTVTVITGSPVPQGSDPQAAIEGYAGTQLLGGVVIDLGIPNYAPFDGKLRLYLPTIKK